MHVRVYSSMFACAFADALGFVLFFAETVYCNTAVVGDGSRHSSRGCDDARGRVIAHDVVRGFAVFSSSTQDVDLSIAN